MFDCQCSHTHDLKGFLVQPFLLHRKCWIGAETHPKPPSQWFSGSLFGLPFVSRARAVRHGSEPCSVRGEAKEGMGDVGALPGRERGRQHQKTAFFSKASAVPTHMKVPTGTYTGTCAQRGGRGKREKDFI